MGEEFGGHQWDLRKTDRKNLGWGTPPEYTQDMIINQQHTTSTVYNELFARYIWHCFVCTNTLHRYFGALLCFRF